MTPQRLGRLITVSTAALLALMLVGPGIATAATPGWQFRNTLQEPTTVADGGVASFKFQIFNNGRSNISKLFLTDSYNGAALSVTNSRGVTCQTSPQLYCSFGALGPKAFINVQVLYRVGTTDFTTTFQLDSSGDPVGGNNSHGDSLLKTLTTFVNTSANYDGSYLVNTNALQTGGTLGSGNKQTTKLDPPETGIGATIEDGGPSFNCSIGDCARQIGEWSAVNVANNKLYGSAFKVTILIWGGAVPGGVGANDIFLLHTRDDGSTYTIDTTCNSATAPTNAECIKVAKVGNNFRIEAWLFQNGGLRGGY